MTQVSLQELWSQHAGSLRKTAYAIIHDYHSVEDILQNAFLKAWINSGKLRSGIPNYAWLRRVVYNECVDHLRKNQRKETLALEQCSEMYLSEECQLDDLLESIVIESFINDLPKGQRDIIMLHYFEGYTSEQIGEVLHIPEGTVKSRLFTSRLVLKQSMSRAVEYE